MADKIVCDHKSITEVVGQLIQEVYVLVHVEWLEANFNRFHLVLICCLYE